MTEPPDALEESQRWLREAAEELAVADVLAADEQLPARAACFHAHLAAEKAMKALLIFRGIVLKHSHDLAYLRSLLSPSDGDRFGIKDLMALNPWTIEGRYPADLGDSAPSEVRDLAAAARRVVDVVTQTIDGV